MTETFRLTDESILNNGVHIEIFNLQGSLVKLLTGRNGSQEFDVSDLVAGSYRVVITEIETGSRHQSGFIKD